MKFPRIFFILLHFIFYHSIGFSQPRILHYSETSGYDHDTRTVSFQMFSQLANELGLIVDNDSTGDIFNSYSILSQYDLIVFSNTTGDAILNSLQKTNFETFIYDGGNFIGLHSATDTYRHSSSNGLNTGAWDFYPEMLGASVRQNPSHVNGLPVYVMSHVQAHPLLLDIPSPWIKAEEYYYWDGGYFDSTGNNILLSVEETIGPNGLVNNYDSSRATAWYREIPSGSKIFYTSLGHDESNFTTDTLFYKLIRNALNWSLGLTSDNELNYKKEFYFINPSKNFLEMHALNTVSVSVFDLTGKKIINEINFSGYHKVDMTKFSQGLYFLNVKLDLKEYFFKVIKL